jgi:hypothetical protein
MFICSRVSIGRICTRVRPLLNRLNLHPLVVDQNAGFSWGLGVAKLSR